MVFLATKNGRTKNFPPFSLVLLLDPGSGIRDPGWIKIRIRNKHPGSATLHTTGFQPNCTPAGKNAAHQDRNGECRPPFSTPGEGEHISNDVTPTLALRVSS